MVWECVVSSRCIPQFRQNETLTFVEGDLPMSVFFLGPILGLGGLAFVLTILEGLAVSVVLAVLAERYLFPIQRD
jgi:hypothetical protein